ncbi:MAG: twin-arginine translocase TatA/TatE family subunit [Beijerinckiaceae bacterium]|nr:twin-arginine translocase TatA/TatE family subunit [Beijerinckiaceae bacterium]
MGSMSIWHWLVVAVIVLLLFGRGKIPELMGDVAKGIKSFKAGMKDEEAAKADEPAKEIEGKAGEIVKPAEAAKTEPKAG